MKSKISRQKEEDQATHPLDIEAVLRERYHKDEAVAKRQPAAPRPTSTKAERAATAQKSQRADAPPPPRTVQTKTARIAGAGKTGRKRNVIRVSVDFPVGLYEAVVAASNEEEQTIREFILNLVRARFA